MEIIESKERQLADMAIHVIEKEDFTTTIEVSGMVTPNGALSLAVSMVEFIMQLTGEELPAILTEVHHAYMMGEISREPMVEAIKDGSPKITKGH
jgi:hypothetical protein